MIRKVALTVLVTLCMAAFSACHTVHGIGQDIESGGKAVQKSTGK
jgi:predicted small secreted protein